MDKESNFKTILQGSNSSFYLRISLIAIVVIGFYLRLQVALSQGWLADETFNIDRLASWFLTHFWQYFLQFQHTTFPPASPYFVNPPLGPVLMTAFISIGYLFNLPNLIGARLMNVFAGTISCILIFLIGQKMFGKKAGLLAAALFAISPVAIAIDGSAYLDTLLSMFFLAGLYLLLDFWENENTRSLYLSAFPFSLAILTKYYLVPLLMPVVFFLAFHIKNKKLGLEKLGIFLLILVAVPVVLWAGARDPNHIIGVAQYIFNLNAGDYSPLIKDYSGISIGNQVGLLYYPLMLIGRLASIESILFLFSVFLFFYYLLAEKKFRWYETILLSTIIFYILFIDLFGGIRTTTHRIFALWPLVTLFSCGIFLKWATNITKENGARKQVQTALIIAVILIGFYEVLFWAPPDYNAFNNWLIGGVSGGSKFYRIGDGEGLERAGQWLNQNTPAGSRIAAPRVWYLLGKYVKDRSMIQQPLNRNIEYAFAKGAQYMVFYNSFLSGGINFQGDSNKMKNVYNVRINDQNYVQIYALVHENFFSRFNFIDIGNQNTWQVYKSKGNNAKLAFGEKSLIIDYNIASGTIILKRNLLSNGADGIFISLEGTGRIYQIELNWFESASKNSNGKTCGYSKPFSIDWKGKRDFYITIENMAVLNCQANPRNLDSLNIIIYGSKIQSKIKLDGMSLIKRTGGATKVFLQIDDISKITTSTRNLIDAISDFNFPVSLSVVPFKLENSTAKFILNSKLAKENKIDVVQHGWSHYNHADANNPNEFPASIDLNKTISELNQGKILLSRTFGSHFNKFFAPPWNKMDYSNIPALSELGFAGVSNILMPDAYENYFQKNKIKRSYVCDFYSSQYTLNKNIDNFLTCKKISATNTFGVVLHSWDFESDQSISQLKDFFSYLQKENVPVVNLEE